MWAFLITFASAHTEIKCALFKCPVNPVGHNGVMQCPGYVLYYRAVEAAAPLARQRLDSRFFDDFIRSYSAEPVELAR